MKTVPKWRLNRAPINGQSIAYVSIPNLHSGRCKPRYKNKQQMKSLHQNRSIDKKKEKKRKENTLIQTHINIFNGHDLIWKQLNDILKESATFSVFNFPVKRMKRERKVVSQFAIKDSCKIENKKMVSNWKLRTINQLGNVSTNCTNQRAGQRFCCSFEPSAVKQTVSGFKQ